MQYPRHVQFLAWTLAAALSGPSAFAAEGMWTLDNLPRAQLQAQHGFSPDAAWVQKVMRSSVRLAGGCSGSFISPDGLVMTNHHCVTRCLAQVSSPGNDRMANGFLARESGQELRCAETELNRLESIIDVTDKVRAATAGKQGAAFHAAEDAARAGLTRECRGADATSTRCDLVTLYQGGQYQLYKYHRFSDVRLVWAPEAGISDFGGDPDNFNFPRWCLDVAMLRAYEGGKPAAVADYFHFKPAGAEAGELVFVTGHPGSTQRQLTVAQLETLRDNLALQGLPSLTESRGGLVQFAKLDAESRRLAMTGLQGIENGVKVSRGRLEALLDPALLDRKRKEESELKAFVAARPDLQARVGDAWAAIERAQGVKREIDLEHTLIEEARGFGSDYFQYARTLVRGTAERSKPNAERLREFSDTSLPQAEQRLRAAATVYPAFEQLKLSRALSRLQAQLGPDHPVVRQVLGTRSPDQAAQSLIAGTRLGDVAERQRLWAGGAAAVDASKDPFIVLVRALEPTARALRKRYDTEVRAVETEALQRIAIASFARSGTNIYPDATFSLRLSYGEVKGWEEKGQTVAPFTDFAGLARRATGAFPFTLPPSWQAAMGRINPAQRFNMSSANDIIGGNSGSPVINRQGEIVALAFDGNIHSLGGAYAYDDKLNRSVSLHAGAIVEALRQVYRADKLLDEILGSH